MARSGLLRRARRLGRPFEQGGIREGSAEVGASAGERDRRNAAGRAIGAAGRGRDDQALAQDACVEGRRPSAGLNNGSLMGANQGDRHPKPELRTTIGELCLLSMHNPPIRQQGPNPTPLGAQSAVTHCEAAGERPLRAARALKHTPAKDRYGWRGRWNHTPAKDRYGWRGRWNATADVSHYGRRGRQCSAAASKPASGWSIPPPAVRPAALAARPRARASG